MRKLVFPVTLRVLKEEIHIGRELTAPECSTELSMCCDMWLELNKTRIRKPTYAKYYTIISNHIKPFLGDYPVCRINTALIGRFTAYLLEEKNLGVKTVKDILSVLKAILTYVQETSATDIPPVRIIYPRIDRGELRILEKSECTVLIEYLATDMDETKLGVLLALTAGLRIGEVCGLRWKDISFGERTLSVNSTVQRIRNFEGDSRTSIVIGPPKSRSAVRTIPLTGFTYNALRKLRCSNPHAFILTGTEECMEPRKLQRRTKKYMDDCGICDAHFHTMRHTFATRCIEAGFDVKTLSEILGHSDISITMNRYVHPDMELKRKNMKMLERTGF